MQVDAARRGGSTGRPMFEGEGQRGNCVLSSNSFSVQKPVVWRKYGKMLSNLVQYIIKMTKHTIR